MTLLSGFADEHVQEAIVVGLRRRGMDLVTVQDLDMRGADDDVLLDKARQLGRLMLTSDQDFLVIHAQWMNASKDHAGIAYWPGGWLKVGEAVRRIIEYAGSTNAEQARNTLHYL